MCAQGYAWNGLRCGIKIKNYVFFVFNHQYFHKATCPNGNLSNQGQCYFTLGEISKLSHDSIFHYEIDLTDSFLSNISVHYPIALDNALGLLFEEISSNKNPLYHRLYV